MKFIVAAIFLNAGLADGSLRKAPAPAMVNKDSLKAPSEEQKAPSKKKACVCANGKPCHNPEVPGHPESECQCASPQGECPEHKNGTSIHEDWGAEYENPQTETKWKGKVGDTNYYKSGSSTLKVTALVFATAGILTL